MHHQHTTHTTQPASRSVQDRTSHGLQLPAVKVLQKKDVIQRQFLADHFSDIDLVRKYVKEQYPGLLEQFDHLESIEKEVNLYQWIGEQMGVTIEQVWSWNDQRGQSMPDFDTLLASFQSNVQPAQQAPVQLPNSQWVKVGEKGWGVFNLFTFAGKQWIATAYHVVADISGQYGKGLPAAPGFIKGHGWAGEVKLIMAHDDDDYILYEVGSPMTSYPEIQLGAVNNDAPEELTVMAPRKSGGVKVTPQDVRKPRDITEQKPPRYMFPNGRLRYIGETQGGDSGSAIVNAGGQMVGLHQMDKGGMGFKKGQKVYDYLMEQKQK